MRGWGPVPTRRQGDVPTEFRGPVDVPLCVTGACVVPPEVLFSPEVVSHSSVSVGLCVCVCVVWGVVWMLCVVWYVV